MWLSLLALTGAIFYLAAIAGMYFAQTWLLFPTTLVAGQVSLPSPAQRLELRVPGGDLLVGAYVPASAPPTQDQLTLLGFGGNAWNADAMAVLVGRKFLQPGTYTAAHRCECLL